MSHFSVIVVGDNVEEQLAPFHEFECTGVDDQYVQEIDQTEDHRHEYETAVERVNKDPEGNLHDPYDAKFYRDPLPGENVGLGAGCSAEISWDSRDWGDGRGYRAKVRYLPEGWEETKVFIKDLKTFAQFLEDWYGHKATTKENLDLAGDHKYGYALIDSDGNVIKSIDRTNPNAKWDWYVYGHGSRFQRRLRHKNGSLTDCLLKGDIDFDRMRDEKEREAAERWSLTRDTLLAADAPLWRSWDEILVEHPDNIEDARAAYSTQPGVVAVQKELRNLGIWDGIDSFLIDLPTYVKNEGNRACVPFAILYNGVWMERGKMGWWACVSDEDDNWDNKAFDFLVSLPDDVCVTVVDCHI